MKRAITSIALSFLLFAFFVPAVVGADSIKAPRGFAGKLYKGTFELYGTLGAGTEAVCTITPYERIPGGYHLITAGHCVKLAPPNLKFSVAEEISGTLMPVTLLRVQYEGSIDFAEFELKTNKKYSIVTLGDEHDLRIGDKVINPNFALSLGKQISRGIVSSKLLSKTASCLSGCYDNFLVQMYGGKGASGSVVIAEKTRQVVGLVVYEFSQPVGFSIEPISRFYEFLKTPMIVQINTGGKTIL